MMKTILWFRHIFCVAILITTVSCSGTDHSLNEVILAETPVLPSPVGEITIESSGLTLVALSISELAHYSDIVILGRFVTKEKIINTARNPADISLPAPRFFDISQVYQVDVEQYIKGNGAKEIYVTQYMGTIKIGVNDNVKEYPPSLSMIEDVIQRNNHKVFEPVVLDAPYFMFLRAGDPKEYELDGYLSTQLYSGVLEPWLFALANGCAFPESPRTEASLYFHPLPVDDFIEQVNSPYLEGKETIEASAYPPPGDDKSSICLPEPTRIEPYP